MSTLSSWVEIQNKKHGKATLVTSAIILGSLGMAALLSLMLIIYDLLIIGHLSARTLPGIIIALYLLYALYLCTRSRTKIANWMVIILYEIVVLSLLMYWGLNTAAGLLTICFVIILPGVLLGSKYIFPVTATSIAMMIAVQTVHVFNIIQPNRAALSEESTYFDVLTYSAILSILALVSWLAQIQTEQSLQRALNAEAKIKKQKAAVTAELKQESATLRQTRLKHSQHLYQFALLGQSSAATLHELSNLLSILNLDIADLSQQNKNSVAINNATDTIAQINKTVRQARRQLNGRPLSERFSVIEVVTKSIEDISTKYSQRRVTLIEDFKRSLKPTHVTGCPAALMQVVTILLNNALDACQDLDEPWVSVKVERKNDNVVLSIVDSGTGIDESLRDTLFQPKYSTKPSGLGVGLYLAKHLTETQLSGSIRLEKSSSRHGAEFTITLPVATKHAKKTSA